MTVGGQRAPARIDSLSILGKHMFVFTQGSELRSFWKETDSNLLGQTLRADGVPAHRVDTGIVGDVDRLGLQRKMRGVKS